MIGMLKSSILGRFMLAYTFMAAGAIINVIQLLAVPLAWVGFKNQSRNLVRRLTYLHWARKWIFYNVYAERAARNLYFPLHLSLIICGLIHFGNSCERFFASFRLICSLFNLRSSGFVQKRTWNVSKHLKCFFEQLRCVLFVWIMSNRSIYWFLPRNPIHCETIRF